VRRQQPEEENNVLYGKHVHIAESALLVIDAQDSFKADARWEHRDNKAFEINVGQLVQIYRRNRLPVFFFLHTDDDPGFERTSPYYKLMDFLSPTNSEPVIHKNTRNVFTSTGLSELLMEKKVRRVVITGIQMEQCCETSARRFAPPPTSTSVPRAGPLVVCGVSVNVLPSAKASSGMASGNRMES
jgi:isochorismate hydrolase